MQPKNLNRHIKWNKYVGVGYFSQPPQVYYLNNNSINNFGSGYDYDADINNGDDNNKYWYGW